MRQTWIRNCWIAFEGVQRGYKERVLLPWSLHDRRLEQDTRRLPIVFYIFVCVYAVKALWFSSKQARNLCRDLSLWNGAGERQSGNRSIEISVKNCVVTCRSSILLSLFIMIIKNGGIYYRENTHRPIQHAAESKPKQKRKERPQANVAVRSKKKRISRNLIWQVNFDQNANGTFDKPLFQLPINNFYS